MGIFDTSFLEENKNNVVVDGDPELTALFNFENEEPIKKKPISIPTPPTWIPENQAENTVQQNTSIPQEDNFTNEEDFDNFLNSDFDVNLTPQTQVQPTMAQPQPQPQPQVQSEIQKQPQMATLEKEIKNDDFEDSFEKDFFDTNDNVSTENNTTVQTHDSIPTTNTIPPVSNPQIQKEINQEVNTPAQVMNTPNQVVNTPAQAVNTPVVQENIARQTEQITQEVVNQAQQVPANNQELINKQQINVPQENEDFSLIEEKQEVSSGDISLIKNGEYDYEALNDYYKAMVQEEEEEEVERSFDTANNKDNSKSNVFSAEMIMAAEGLKYGQNEDNKFAQVQKDFEEQRAERQLFDQIMISAINQDATDIHFELNWNNIIIKFRILWGLQVQTEIEVPTYSRLLNYLKDIFKMKVDENREHQDGSYSYIYLDGNQVQSKKRLRAVIMPTYKKYEEVGDIRNTGKIIEILVIRLLAQSTKPFHALGLEEYRETILSAIDTEGIFLISWPTGSWKTTTLASIATYIAQRDPSRKFYSVEDPVEIELSQITQLELTDKFKIINAIKGLLRWDPDIMMIWEIREILNMEFAIDAANTWHIVFWTIHTKNAISIPNRIRTQGANVELFMEAANLFHAQRLVPISWKNISVKELKKKMYIEKNMDYIKSWYYRDFIYWWDKLIFKEFILKNQLLRRNILWEKFYKNLKNPKLEKFKILLRVFLDGGILKIKGEQIKFNPFDEKIFKMLCDFIEENIYINDIIYPNDEQYIRMALGLWNEVEEVPKSKGRYPIVEILNFKDVNIKLLMERPNPEQEILNQEINFLTMFQDAFIKSVIYGKPWLLQKEDKRVLSLNIIDYIREWKQIYGLNDSIEKFYQELAKKK